MIGETLLRDVVKHHRLKVHLVKFDVNEWGSCQYAGALDAYNVLDALCTKLRDKRAAMRELGVVVRCSGVRRDPTAALKEWRTEEQHDPIVKEINMRRATAEMKRGTPRTYDEVLVNLRKAAWDLWCAAPVVASIAFKDLRVSAMTAPGIGPLANVMTQGMNYRTGVCCWLLAREGLAQKTSFAEFDT